MSLLGFFSLAKLRAAALVAPLVVVVGCGRDEAPAAPPPLTGCAALLSTCLADQKSCVEDAAGDARCEACAVGQYAADSGQCEAIGGSPLAHDFETFTVEPGVEIEGLCQSWTLGNATEIWVNAVELEQDVASHHSNWTFVPSDQFEGPDGIWSCAARGYNQVTAALSGGVIYAQSTQAPREVQKFPAGVAVRIPPYSRIIGDVHLLNTGDEPVTGHSKLTIYGVPAADVAHKLVPFHLTYTGLAIPPHAKSRFYGECDVSFSYSAALKRPLDQQVYYILPHTHAMASRFFLEIMGGPRDGETIVDLSGFNGEAHGRVFPTPVDMRGAEGYRFGCEYDNPRDETVSWGFGDQEMCELLGFAEADAGFESKVTYAENVGSDGDVQLFTSLCSTLAFVWDHDKPGGPPPQP